MIWNNSGNEGYEEVKDEIKAETVTASSRKSIIDRSVEDEEKSQK